MNNKSKPKLVKKEKEKNNKPFLSYIFIVIIVIIVIMGFIAGIWYAVHYVNPKIIENGINQHFDTVYLNVGDEGIETSKDIYINDIDKLNGYKIESIIDPGEENEEVKSDLDLKDYRDHITVSTHIYQYVDDLPVKRIHQSEHTIELLLKGSDKVYTTYIRVHINEVSLDLFDQTMRNSLALLPGENEKTFKYTNYNLYKKLNYDISNIDFKDNNKIFDIKKSSNISFDITKKDIGQGDFTIRANSDIDGIFAEKQYHLTNEISNEINLERNTINLSADKNSTSVKINNFSELNNDGYKFDQEKTNHGMGENSVTIEDDKLKIESDKIWNSDLIVYFKNTKFENQPELSAKLIIVQDTRKNIIIDNNDNDFNKNIDLGTTTSLKITNFNDFTGGRFEVELPDKQYTNKITINKNIVNISSELTGTNKIRILYIKTNSTTLTSSYITIKNVLSKDKKLILNNLEKSLDLYNNTENYNNHLLVVKINDVTEIQSLSNLYYDKYFDEIQWKNKDTILTNSSLYSYVTNFMRIMIYISQVDAKDLLKFTINTNSWGEVSENPIAVESTDGGEETYTKNFVFTKKNLKVYSDAFSKNYKSFSEELNKIDVFK